MKNSTLLFVFGFSFVSCKGDMENIYFLRDRLVIPLMYISSYIKAKRISVDDCGKIIQQPDEINFPRAHALFSDVAKNLQEYPKIIKYSIAQSILEDINQILSQLKQDIEDLPDGLEKNQFRKEWNKLAQYVSYLLAK